MIERVVCCSMLIAAVACAPADEVCASGSLFASPTSYAAGSQPEIIVSGDLNNDGSIDLVVGNRFSDDVTVLINDGSGSMNSGVSYDAGEDAIGVSIGDLDGDGFADLLVSNEFSDQISVLLNLGDGSFGVRTVYDVGARPQHSVLGDFDSDGDLDAVVVCERDDAVQLLLNDGTGVFAAPLDLAVGDEPHSIVAADLTGNGSLDLAIGNLGHSTISVLVNLGNAFFAPGGVHDVPNARELFAADLNADGAIDLASVGPSESPGAVHVLFNNGSGGFAPPLSFDAGPDPNSISGGDLNQDGFIDLVVADTIGDCLTVLLNDGGSGFASPEFRVVGTFPISVVVDDLDGDGLLDLAAADGLGYRAWVVRNQGDAHFGAELWIPRSVDGEMRNVVSADLDGDGLLDLAFSSSISTVVSTVMNNGRGAFGVVDTHNAFTTSTAILAADLTGLGFTDLVISNSTVDRVRVLVRNGSGDYQVLQTLVPGDDPREIAAGDLDGDGDLDLVVANRQSDEISVFMHSGFWNFQSAVNYPSAVAPWGLALGDLDDDGDLDVLVGAAGVWAHLNDGSGGLADPVQIMPGVSSRLIRAADLNSDGMIDFVVSDHLVAGVGVLINQGSLVFEYDAYPFANGSANAIDLADADSDGDLDIAIGKTNAMKILLNDGSGGFPEELNSSGTRYGVAFGDFDQNGRMDLASTRSTSSDARVRYGFCESVDSCAADLTGDGSLDIFDVFAFLDAFNSAQASADINGDGVLDIFDVFGYLDLFNAGCE